MADDATTFRDRATQARADAANTSLQNVRERCERSAATWEAMAVRAERVAHERAMKVAAQS
ncbi:hypothetical protein [Sphingomonas sp. Y38-1Y]|jgi:hypothetical protein|uniref:hypothetical protein n=1 Tax=Sphingomonas sp. Y38-1Y TaxID=3078265 RepID=UPI0028EAA2C8|nr:hypothetical protein [Sphingomonas sp. Y38-1Y]